MPINSLFESPKNMNRRRLQKEAATERMKVIGHASETANRVYSHAEQDSIRARMDTIGKPKPALLLIPKPAQAS